jgi:Uma2 family endonuclease
VAGERQTRLEPGVGGDRERSRERPLEGPGGELSTYPDAAVVCGRTLRAAEDPLAVTNPVLLVEVTSPSTEDYDRGEKLRHYKSLPSVREVLIASHREPRVALHRRGERDAWSTESAGEGELVRLSCVGARLAVDEIYRDGLEEASNEVGRAAGRYTRRSRWPSFSFFVRR